LLPKVHKFVVKIFYLIIDGLAVRFKKFATQGLCTGELFSCNDHRTYATSFFEVFGSTMEITLHHER
jgi:hypothetical protein